MNQLEPPDSHYLNAAQGWLELGSAVEAVQELRHIATENARHPDVLELHWSIQANQKRWEEALVLARQIIAAAPERCSGWIDQSYALHELKRTAEAREQLLTVTDKFPGVAIIPYNLACYCCQLGDPPAARQWLEKAMKAGSGAHIRRMAMEDADLQPMWPEIQRMKA